MQKPPERLPPLDLLVTFEAAARHLSFTRAADERFVTQSAVSRQIRALEEGLGVRLFRRRHRALALTDEGRVLQAACAEALAQLRETVRRLRTPHARQVLTVTTTPGLAALWLIPRLAGFTRTHPGIDVRIDASLERRDFARDGVDVAIRYSSGASTDGAKLFDEEVLPVCSPALLDGQGPPLRTPRDLAGHTLLRLDESVAGPLQEWQPWLVAVGVPDLQPRAVLTFSHYDGVINAAIHGQGVALGRRPLVDAMLRDGRLIAPIRGTLSSAHAYFVVVAPGGERSEPVAALSRWLLAEGGATAPPPTAAAPDAQPARAGRRKP